MTDLASKIREMAAKRDWSKRGKHGREHVSKKYRIAINRMTIDGVLRWRYLAFAKLGKKWKPLAVFGTPDEARQHCRQHCREHMKT